MKLTDKYGKIFKYEDFSTDKYKYRVTKKYDVKLQFKPNTEVVCDFYCFYLDGILVINKGYQWDGASGPTIDTQNTIIASCIHDVLYQMIRCKQLPLSFKKQADKELKFWMIENSEKKNLWNKIRAYYFYFAVKLFAGSSCIPGSQQCQ